MKTFKRISLGILLVSVLVILLLFYREKLGNLFATPTKFISIILSATGLAAFSLQVAFIDIGIFASAALIDLFNFGWQKSALRRLFFIRSKSARGDLWCWALSVLSLYDFFALVFSLGIFYVISNILVKLGNFQLIQLIPSVGLQFSVIFLLSDLKQYVWHRFMHLTPFWELHKYHHSATEFNLITNSRGHFIEKGILIVFDSLLFSLLGAPLHLFTVLILFREFYNQILHSELNWSLGLVGKYLLISPKAHRIHHSSDSKFYNSNFGTFFIFWDKLFGTFKSSIDPIQIGIQNNPYNKNGFWWDMKEGVISFIKGFNVKG